MVGLVASGPEVETFVLGKMAFEGPDMRRDTIFRIASMTKPVTATAVMMLVEEASSDSTSRSRRETRGLHANERGRAGH